MADWTLQRGHRRELLHQPGVPRPDQHRGAPGGLSATAHLGAQGLKFAVRTGSGWRCSRAHGGRVKHVAMVLDQMPGLFGQPPSNAPHIAFVVARQGAYLVSKAQRQPGRILGPTLPRQGLSGLST